MYLFDELQRWDSPLTQAEFCPNNRVHLTSRVGSRMLRRKGGRVGDDARLNALTVPVVRRMLTQQIWTANHPADFVLPWAQWRRKHHAEPRSLIAKDACHY